MGTGILRRVFTDSAIRMVSDGDFQATMEHVNFKGTPREEITVQDMIDHHNKTLFYERLEDRARDKKILEKKGVFGIRLRDDDIVSIDILKKEEM